MWVFSGFRFMRVSKQPPGVRWCVYVCVHATSSLSLLRSQWVKNIWGHIHHVGPQLALICREGVRPQPLVVDGERNIAALLYTKEQFLFQ